MKVLWLLLCSAVACATAGSRPPAPPTSFATSRMVDGFGFCTARDHDCAWRVYARTTDPGMSGPVYWLRSVGGEACEVSGAVAMKLRRGDQWICEWRVGRR